MKRCLVFTLAMLMVVCCFTGCGKNPDDESVTFGAVENKDGSYERNENGEVFEIVTNADGKEETSAVELTRAVTKDNLIEYNYFSIELDKDWEAGDSFKEVNFHSKDGKKDICIMTKELVTEAGDDGSHPGASLFGYVETAAQQYGGTVSEGDAKICGTNAQWKRIDYEKGINNGNGTETWSVTYYTFDAGRASYGIFCYGYEKGVKNSEFEKVLAAITIY